MDSMFTRCTSIPEKHSASGVQRWLVACIAHSQFRYLVDTSMDDGHLVPVIMLPRRLVDADLVISNPDCGGLCVSISARSNSWDYSLHTIGFEHECTSTRPCSVYPILSECMPPAEKSLCQRELTGIIARFDQSLLTIRIQCGLKVRVASDLGKSLWLVIRYQH
jgi:hypothetical protein